MMFQKFGILPVTSQDPFSVTGEGNSEERTCLTVDSVFAWGLGITLKFLTCYLNMIRERPKTD